ncbi:hypothetical protein EUX98_g5031 [Antrodiella citrinella]|uniref:3'-5' exonuclease domain-containing protein n=1 Tax=Antrodiella citrinella TaxID=2447956 RepID=A0A4S4MSI9_9APHY|nr:hypothetical protein EUX98_g5031 [Antrodiella citrinella]
MQAGGMSSPGASSKPEAEAKAKKPKAEKPPKPPPMKVKYTYVQEYNQLPEVISALTKSPHLLLDCEGRSIGSSEGALSLISVGTAGSKVIFVIDVLRLCDPTNPHFRKFLAILQDPGTLKVVWDGRMDYAEIYATFGIQLLGVLDLQIAEVMARTTVKQEEDYKRRGRLRRIFDKTIMNDRQLRPLMNDFYLVNGLQGIIKEEHIVDNIAKDDEVQALHKAGNSHFWLDRPLPSNFLEYAATDIMMVSLTYEYFIKKRWVTTSNFLSLEKQSHRYMAYYNGRGKRVEADELGTIRFLPLDVIHYDTDPTQYQCHICFRMLNLYCFETLITAASANPYYKRKATIALLRNSPHLIIDCEGQSIGSSDGVLSLLSVGTAGSKDIFVIDVLRLCDRTNSHLSSFLELLQEPGIRKVVWDGRMDYAEIYVTFGIKMSGLLDLQIAEVMARETVNYERDFERRNRFKWFFASTRIMNNRDLVPLMKDFHLINGLQGVIRREGIVRNIAKDDEVTAMHKAGNSQFWLHRPLPPNFLQYAATDIQMISLTYEYFLAKKWITRVNISSLEQQSLIYTSYYHGRDKRDPAADLGTIRFLPLDVVHYHADAKQYQCHKCQRMLNMDCFESLTSAQSNGNASRRRPCCRLCAICAQAKNVAVPTEWLAV